MAESIILVTCPHCACPRTSVVEVRNAFGMTSENRQCDHCGKNFQHTPTVLYDPNPIRILCPSCRTKNPPVTRTITRRDDRGKDLGTVRYHRCERCAYTFKSTEAPAS